MEIPKKIKDEIWEYCRLNNIPNIDEFMLKMLTQGLTIEKYGAAPTAREKIVEKTVEKIVEVPVEKIIEVPVEVEKIIEKEVFISDNGEITQLTSRITKLESTILTNTKSYNEKYKEFETELKTKDELIEKLNQELEVEKKKAIKRDIYGEG